MTSRYKCGVSNAASSPRAPWAMGHASLLKPPEHPGTQMAQEDNDANVADKRSGCAVLMTPEPAAEPTWAKEAKAS